MDENQNQTKDEIFEEKKWKTLHTILSRKSPFAPEQFHPGKFTTDFLHKVCRVLIVGAGGLGCDLLKNLAMSGFKNIDIIDMDTIDQSNLNRQFLFREKDVSKSKAETAAAFVNKRCPGVKVTPHYCMIQDKDIDFYQQFQIIICGLDSIRARKWINKTLFDMVRFSDPEEKNIDMSTCKPFIDGGTEGFKGQARIIFPRVSSCYECTLDMLPDEENFPLCTIKTKPRFPEHCIQYAYLVEWDNCKDKSDYKIKMNEKPNGDNPIHIKWLYDKAIERSKEFNINGVTKALVKGVVKRIIPVFAATNAIVASMCTNEALKLATLMAKHMDDYCTYNGNEGIYMYTLKNEKREHCNLCSVKHQRLTISIENTVQDLLNEGKKIKFLSELHDIAIDDSTGETVYTTDPLIQSTLQSMTMDGKIIKMEEQKLNGLIDHDEIISWRGKDKHEIIRKFQTTIRYLEEESGDEDSDDEDEEDEDEEEGEEDIEMKEK